MRPLAPDQPFVLLDDARAGDRRALLFRAPHRIECARSQEEVPVLLAAVREAMRAGRHLAGYLAYGAGHAFEPRLAALGGGEADLPLGWFGLFDPPEAIAGRDVPALLPDPAAAWSDRAAPAISRADYQIAFDRVAALIQAGDIYQANLTFPALVRFAGHPLALYAALRDRARAPHGGIVWTGRDWLLSFSPELFFTLEQGRLTTRPMKGTAARLSDPSADRAAADVLARDPKQRAENLMIVDLLRNDLSRVAVPGSVAVPALFTVEEYPTVHQMTSTVTATLTPGRDAVDVLKAMFPCGSVTGAPKLRAMEVIAEVEAGPRDVYTGSIGHIAPDGEAAFNVAIRTLHVKDGATVARLGLGSGIVADSVCAAEWQEALAKGRFVGTAGRIFDLIETMAFDPQEGLLHLERHLARMKASADALGFAFDRHGARNELQAATFRLTARHRVRLLLARSGALAIEVGAPRDWPAEPMPVALIPLPVSPDDFRLRHKTTDRAFYDAARKTGGTEEVVLVRPDGVLTEGSFSTLFVERDGRLLTPPAERGLLPGILRAVLLAEGRAVEADLRAEDLAGGFLLGNASRGMVKACLVEPIAPSE